MKNIIKVLGSVLTVWLLASAANYAYGDALRILSTQGGGTGWGNIQSNTVILGNGTGALATTTAGTNGQYLKLVGGVPTWAAVAGGGGGSGQGWATSTNPELYYMDSPFIGVLNGSATSTTGNALEVVGSGLFRNALTSYGVSTAPYFTATSTTATSTFPYLSVTTNSNVGTVVGGTWQGTAIGDAYLTKTGAWTGTFDGQEGSYYLNAGNLTNFGTPFYTFLSATNTDALAQGSTNKYYSALLFSGSLAGTTTDALAQGSTNKYWSNTLFDNRLSASSSISGITTLPNLSILSSQVSDLATYWDGRMTATTTLPSITTLANLATVGTITTGVWNGTAIDISAKTNLAVTYPMVLTGDTLSLAFSTTTSNTWASTQTFSALAGAIDAGGATSFEIPNGASPTVDATGECALDTTTDQLICFGATAKKVFIAPKSKGLSMASTTWGTGTTTLSLGFAPNGQAITVTGIRCQTSAGTLQVSVYDGTNRADFVNASTTANFNAFTVNNTFTNGEEILADVGTAATAPTRIGCNADYSIDAN